MIFSFPLTHIRKTASRKQDAGDIPDMTEESTIGALCCSCQKEESSNEKTRTCRLGAQRQQNDNSWKQFKSGGAAWTYENYPFYSSFFCIASWKERLFCFMPACLSPLSSIPSFFDPYFVLDSLLQHKNKYQTAHARPSPHHTVPFHMAWTCSLLVEAARKGHARPCMN